MILVVSVFALATPSISMDKDIQNKMAGESGSMPAAVFAGGCFWCTESDFEKVEGVIEAISGYTGGSMENPSYKQVSSGSTRHVEAVKVVYDPKRVTYAKLLEVFWTHVDPTDAGGQFVDRGSQYVSAIFYANETERRLAESSKVKLTEDGVFEEPIVDGNFAPGQVLCSRRLPPELLQKEPLALQVVSFGLRQGYIFKGNMGQGKFSF